MVNYKITPTIFGQRPEFKIPNPNFLQELTEEGFKKMMSDFYDMLVESDIANFFPQDEHALNIVKYHNTKFFIEACGGPKYYSDEVGHLDMVKMHEPFSITEKARVEWLGTFKIILEKLEVSDDAKQSFWDYIEVFSKHTVNVDTIVKHPEDLAKV